MSKTQTNAAAAATAPNKRSSAKPEKSPTAAPAVVVESNTNAAAVIAIAAHKGLIGTPAQLVEAGVTLNGKPLDLTTFTALRKHFYNAAIATDGYMDKPKGQKGKSTEIVKLINAPGFVFSNPNDAA